MGMSSFDDNQSVDPSQQTNASTVPATPSVNYPAPAAPAPVADPAAQRTQAYQGALDTIYGDKVAPDAAQSVMLRQTPALSPAAMAGLDQAFGVVGKQQSSTVGSTKLTPETKKAEDDAVAAARATAAAQRAEGEVARKSAEEISNLQVQQAQLQQQRAQEDLAKNTAIQKRIDDTMAQGQREVDDYLKSAANVDPNRMMKGGRGVLAAIATGLGAFGAAMTGTPNSALQIVQDAINRDWQAQKDVVDAKKFKSEATGKLVANLRNTLSDSMSMQLAHSSAVNAAMAKQVEGLATKFKGTEAEARANTLSGMLMQKSLEDRAQLLARESVHAQTSTSTTIAPITKPIYGDALSYERKLAEDRHAIAEANGLTAKGDDVTYANEQLKDAVKLSQVIAPLQSARERMRKAVVPGMNIGGSMNSAEMNQDVQFAIEQLGRLRSGGAITEQEAAGFRKELMGGNLTLRAEAMDKLAGRASAWLGKEIRTKLGSVHKELRGQVWEQFGSALGDDASLLHGIRSGNFSSGADKLKDLGATVPATQ